MYNRLNTRLVEPTYLAHSNLVDNLSIEKIIYLVLFFILLFFVGILSL